MNVFKNRLERNLIVGSSWEVRPGRTREISLTGSITPVGKNSVKIKSWPCILLGPLLNSWLPPSMKLDAQFWENCAVLRKLRTARFFLSKLSKHDSSASESAFPSILTVIRFLHYFLISNLTCPYSFIPLLALHLVLQIVQFLCTWHIVYYRW